MAKAIVALRVGFALASGLGVLALLTLVGCQQSRSTVVQKLPAPSLDGPVVKGAAPVAKATPTTHPAANPPAGWGPTPGRAT